MVHFVCYWLLFVGCPVSVVLPRVSFETTETRTETSFGTIRNKTFVSIVLLLYWNREFDFSIEPNNQKTNRNSLFDRDHILVFYKEHLGFFMFFRFFSVCFETVCFGCFASIPKQRVSMFQLNRNIQKTNPNSLKESLFGYFSEYFGLFGLLQNGFVCFGCFDIGSKHRNKPKQFKKFCFWFHETNLYSSCVALFYRKRLPQQNGDRRKGERETCMHLIVCRVRVGARAFPSPPHAIRRRALCAMTAPPP